MNVLQNPCIRYMIGAIKIKENSMDTEIPVIIHMYAAYSNMLHTNIFVVKRDIDRSLEPIQVVQIS